VLRSRHIRRPSFVNVFIGVNVFTGGELEAEGTTLMGDRDADVEMDRALLMSVCYRLLGSISEAEDAVQETYARWYTLSGAARAEIASPTGWLITTASRICLDSLASARVKRQAYVGTWLPELVPPSANWTTLTASGMNADPAERMTIDESVSMALLVVLEAQTLQLYRDGKNVVLDDAFAHGRTESLAGQEAEFTIRCEC
jgi:DNA-directed RNA polymerase specialized sigma24 family protein